MKVLYYNEDDVIKNTNLYDLPGQEAIYNFSAEDQEIINNAAVDDGFYGHDLKHLIVISINPLTNNFIMKFDRAREPKGLPC